MRGLFRTVEANPGTRDLGTPNYLINVYPCAFRRPTVRNNTYRQRYWSAITSESRHGKALTLVDGVCEGGTLHFCANQVPALFSHDTNLMLLISSADSHTVLRSLLRQSFWVIRDTVERG
jgi:hypothetical protein